MWLIGIVSYAFIPMSGAPSATHHGHFDGSINHHAHTPPPPLPTACAGRSLAQAQATAMAQAIANGNGNAFANAAAQAMATGELRAVVVQGNGLLHARALAFRFGASIYSDN
jgi:hypothetical protein